VPVIVQNAGQVNVQKHVRSKKRAKKASATTNRLKRKKANKPKQLGAKSPEESISLKAVSDSVQAD